MFDVSNINEVTKFVQLDTSAGNANLKKLFDLQKEGILNIIQKLETHCIAILADEVGMGKTIQAISIISRLLDRNPNAKILIFAPREVVQENWVKEFKQFIQHDLIRKNNNKTPLHDLIISDKNIFEVFLNPVSINKNIFLTRITSLSYMTSKNAEDGKKNEIRNNLSVYAKEFNCDESDLITSLRSKIGKIDLLVIDEAHMLRNIDGGSNRVIVANELFSKDKKGEYLAEKVLMLTATPNHSKENDIKNIISYFSDSFNSDSIPKIFSELCLRRIKSINNKNKFQYRYEEALATPFKKDNLGELFFAFYQKELLDKLKDSKNKNASLGKLFYGYLEAFESFSNSNVESTNEENENQTNEHKNDFDSISFEKSILNDLSQKFENEMPSHPKYDSVINNILGIKDNAEKEIDLYSLYKNKTLTFVRRVASAGEISNRINEIINQISKDRLYRILKDYFTIDERLLNNEKNLRNFLSKQLISYSDLIDDFEDSIQDNPGNDDSNSDDIETNENNIFHLFRKKTKNGDIKKREIDRTHMQSFRERFTRRDSVFCLFFLPGLKDTLKKGEYLVYHKSGKFNFYDSYKDSYLQKGLKENEFELKKPGNIESLSYSFMDEIINNLNKSSATYEVWKNLTQEEILLFSEYLKKGILYSSPYLLDFYEIYLEALRVEGFLKTREIPQIKIFNAMNRLINEKYTNNISKIKDFIFDCIEFFPTFKNNVASSLSLRNSFSVFDTQEPSYGYTASTKNKTVLEAFNSPFFPYFLISTSVLQEGVNLHFYCNKLIHYGIAWTSGDNEQRVGRVDRLFGKLQREIEKDPENGCLDIIYPYMPDTIDEEQLAQFTKEKYKAEDLLDNDNFSQLHSSNEFKINSVFESDWKEKYLRRGNRKSIY